MTRQNIDCPKCDGKGFIDGLSHYANGICFCCNGKKVVTVDTEKLKSKISDSSRRKAEWIMASTEDSYRNLSFAKLSAIRDFAHGGWGLQEAYPGMLAHYRSVGEWAFQKAQDEHLAAFYSK